MSKAISVQSITVGWVASASHLPNLDGYDGSAGLTQITDLNGNELLKFTTTASAVNELTLANAATGNKPTLSVTGSDTNIGLEVAAKGTGALTFRGDTFSLADNLGGGLAILSGSTVASAVNYLTVTNAATGNPTLVSAAGTDTDVSINLVPKGAGVVQVNGATVRTAQPYAGELFRTSSATEAATASATNPATLATTLTNLGTAYLYIGGIQLVTLDEFANIRVLARVGNTAAQSGTISVELYMDGTTSLVTATTTNVGLTNISATASISQTGLHYIGARIKSDTATDDPLASFIGFELY